MKRILLAEIIVSFVLTYPAFGQTDPIKHSDEIADTLFTDFGLLLIAKTCTQNNQESEKNPYISGQIFTKRRR